MTGDDDEASDPLRDAIAAAYQTQVYTPPAPTDRREFPEITEAEYRSWLAPQEMIDAMPYGIASYEQLRRELGADRYLSAADEVIWIHDGHTGRDKFGRVPSWVWRNYFPAIDSDFWRTGYLDVTVSKPGSYGYAAQTSLQIYGARFWSPAIAAAPAIASAVNTASASKQNGRPPKDYWEDLVIAMVVKWADGDLKPKRQADVAEAMKDWLDQNRKGENWSETPLKERAKKVFLAIQAAETKP